MILSSMRRGTFFSDFPATSILLILCLSFYALEVYYTHKFNENEQILKSAFSIDPRVLLKLGSGHLELLKRGEMWRVISAAFLHAGAIHILFNLWILSDLGRFCEPLLGKERFTVAYVASAVGGSLGTAAYATLSRGIGFSVGASGAVLGLIGLLFAFSVRHRERELRDQLSRWIIYIVIITILIETGGSIRIDHAAHAGGFITGAIFGYFTPRYVSSQSARSWRLPFWMAVLITALSLGYALGYFFKGPVF